MFLERVVSDGHISGEVSRSTKLRGEFCRTCQVKALCMCLDGLIDFGIGNMLLQIWEQWADGVGFILMKEFGYVRYDEGKV